MLRQMMQETSVKKTKQDENNPGIMVQPSPGENTVQEEAPSAIYICSNHPLAEEVIKQTLSSIGSFQPLVKHLPGFPVPQDGNKPSILVLDTVSVHEWKDILLRWKLNGGHVIALVAPHSDTNDNVRGIYLGAKGTVQMSPELGEELPRAIRTAATDGIWISPGTLAEYVNAANSLLHQISSPNRRLTQREEEVLALLMAGDSNKEIGNSLGISERTAKFHVSSILRKVEIKSRKELIRKVRSSTLSYLDVILYRNGAKSCMPGSKKSA